MAEIRPLNTSPETSLRDFYNVLFRQKKKMLVFFGAVMVVVCLAALLGQKVYRSEAELLMRIGRENATVGPTVATGKVISVNQDRENEINSEADILRSRELAERVVDAIGVDLILHGAKETLPPDASYRAIIGYWARRGVDYPITALSRLLGSGAPSTEAGRLRKKDLAVRSFMDHLGVGTSQKSNIVSIGYETNDPALARDVLNRVVGLYLEKHIEVNRTPGSYTFFKNQKSQLRSSLDQTEEELKNLKNRTAVASIFEQRRILLERIGRLKSALLETESSCAASEARVKAIAATLARLPATVQKDQTTGFASSAADEMRKQIYALELKEQKLLSTFTEKSISVQEIRRQIKKGNALLLKAQQQSQITMGINENYQKMQLDLLIEKGGLASLQASARAIGAQLRSAGGELDALNDTEIRFQQLNRDLATQRSNYLKYSESLEQARIDEALDMQRISNISIVQPATYSIKPVRPKTLLDLALGLLLGILGALGLAFFSELQDHSFKKPEEVVDRLHLPMLAALPMVFPEEFSNGRTPAGPAQEEICCELLLAGDQNGGALGDLLRFCACGTSCAPGSIALVGCHHGAGVSTASALLARQLAKRSRQRVLLVDANFANPCLHSKFRTNLAPGLADFGSSARTSLSCIQSAPFENLDILSAGNRGQDESPEVLKAFSEIFPALRREYSFIICDLPPPLEHGWASGMAALMDGAVLVVEAEKTRREVADKVREALLEANSNIFGVILNKRRFHIPEWLYKTL